MFERLYCLFFFFKQKTACEIKECNWSSDVCSSDLDDGCSCGPQRGFPADFLPDLAVLRLGDEEPTDDGGDDRDHDGIDQTSKDVAVRVARRIQPAQIQAEEREVTRLPDDRGGHQTRIDGWQPATELAVAEMVGN